MGVFQKKIVGKQQTIKKEDDTKSTQNRSRSKLKDDKGASKSITNKKREQHIS